MGRGRDFKSVVQILFGSFLIFSAGIFYHFGNFQEGAKRKGGYLVTPETHPLQYWITISGMALAGLTLIIFTVVRFVRKAPAKENTFGAP